MTKEDIPKPKTLENLADEVEAHLYCADDLIDHLDLKDFEDVSAGLKKLQTVIDRYKHLIR